jgi:hypothetical protein
MATEHDSITDPEIHEPKGVSTASSGQFYLADGVGSGAWRYCPHSQCEYSNIGTGTTITGPTAYTLIGPVTTGDSLPRDFTHNSLGRLTYTGATSLDLSVHASISFKHSTGSGQDCYFQVHKNGSPAGTEMVASADSANYQHISINAHIDITTNDYIEIWCKVATGNIIVHAITIEVTGKI